MSDNQPHQETQDKDTTKESNELGPDAWRQHIPQDMADKGYWKPLESVPLSTVLKSYGNAQEKLGNSITVPEKPDDKEGWAKVYKKIGRPDDPDKYEYETPKIEGVEWNPDAFKEFNKVAFDNGLSNNQVKAVLGWMSDDLKQKLAEQADEAAKASIEAETTLKHQYGKDYESRHALAQRAGNMYFGEEVTKELLQSGSVQAREGLMKLGVQLAEDKAFGSNPVELQGVTNKDEALRRIAEIGNDRKHPYWGNPNDPRTKKAIEEMSQLHKVAYPGSPDLG